MSEPLLNDAPESKQGEQDKTGVVGKMTSMIESVVETVQDKVDDARDAISKKIDNKKKEEGGEISSVEDRSNLDANTDMADGRVAGNLAGGRRRNRRSRRRRHMRSRRSRRHSRSSCRGRSKRRAKSKRRVRSIRRRRSRGGTNMLRRLTGTESRSERAMRKTKEFGQKILRKFDG